MEEMEDIKLRQMEEGGQDSEVSFEDITSSLEENDDDNEDSANNKGALAGDNGTVGWGEALIASTYATLKGVTAFSSREPKFQTTLQWKNINYTLQMPVPPQNFFLKLLLKLPFADYLLMGKREVQILHDISGVCKPGECLAIMGPTGSGKTTLLNVLARRVKTGVTGEVLINGYKPTRRMKRQTAYVLQDDIFFANLTVRETLNYTAYLKLSKKLTLKEKRERVEEALSEMGLQRASNTIIGGHFVRGISGGERKRTNISNELIMNPSLIFLDEPTSGLDSATSLGLIVSLKNLGKSGHTVVTTIHQPSSSMFALLDNVLLLAEGGWVVYHGPTSQVVSYFASLGLYSPPHYNPADFMLELVTSSEKIKDGRTVRQYLIDSWKERIEKNNNSEVEQPVMSEKETRKQMKTVTKYPTPWHTQALVLMMRAFKQRKGDLLTWLDLTQTVLLAVLAGLLWLQMDYTESALGDRTGFLFFITMYWMLMPWTNALFSFPPERAVINKERAAGTFRLSAYFIGKTLAESPIELILPFIFGTITYWMVGLSTDFYCYLLYLLLLFLFVLFGSSMGLFIGTVVVNMKQALSLSVVAILGSTLLGGFFVNKENLHDWIRWARWVSPIKYGYEAMMLNEFKVASSETYTNSDPSNYDTNPITSADVRHHLDIETTIWGDIIFFVGIIIVTRVLAYLALKYLNKPRR